MTKHVSSLLPLPSTDQGMRYEQASHIPARPLCKSTGREELIYNALTEALKITDSLHLLVRSLEYESLLEDTCRSSESSSEKEEKSM